MIQLLSRGETSTLKTLTASIIQGWGIGSTSYVTNANYLNVLMQGRIQFQDFGNGGGTDGERGSASLCWGLGDIPPLGPGTLKPLVSGTSPLKLAIFSN